ncbi:MAG: BatA and WFA domain-containing protein [Pirellulales bacterium]
MLELFHNTLSGWQWAALALVPPAILALYFLKLKRQPLEVPSTYLWKKSIEDLHVNSLWQRLRQSLLLFLQLLLVALAMLALLRPGWQGTKLEGQRFIFLVDNSASMSASDATDAANRLEEAKRLVGGLIDQMESSHTAMIVSFADTSQVVQEFTDNRRLLRERLASIEPTVRATDLGEALELAGGLANPGRVSMGEMGADIEIAPPQPATLYILSDGRFDDVKDFSLGNLTPFYVPIGTFEAENLALTTFTTRRSDANPEQRQAFVQVANFSDAAQSVVVELEHDGHFLDAREVDVPAGETSGIVFPLADAPAGPLVARLKYKLATPTGRDMLQQDDVAYAALNDAKPGRVLVVTPGNKALEVALGTQRAARLGNIQLAKPDILTSEEYKRDADSGGYNLVIYDQCVPPTMPRANALLIGRLPPGPTWRGGEAAAEGDAKSDAGDKKEAPPEIKDKVIALPQILDWDRAHPVLSQVELGNVGIVDSLVLDPPLGATVLIDSTAGPIAAIAARDAYQDVVLGFEIVGQEADGSRTANTNWPNRLSFPTFWLNALEYLAGGTEDSQLANVTPGKSVELRAAGNVEELTVVDPAGKEYPIKRTAEDVFQFHDTQRLGVYVVRRRDQVIERFAVNLFDRQESDVHLRQNPVKKGTTIQPADIRIGHVDVAALADQTPSRKELWKFVLVGALAVLIFEWYIYNRRVYL